MTALGQQLINFVRAHAAEDPEFVYEGPSGTSCVYIYNGRASCLIGHALLDAGVIDTSLELECSDRNHCQVKELNLPISLVELKWLSRVQSYQDCKYTWGEAVELTDAATLRETGNVT